MENAKQVQQSQTKQVPVAAPVQQTPAEAQAGSTYAPPNVWAKAHGIKFEVGKKYNLAALGHGEHYKFGHIPEFTVTRVKDDGSFIAGTFTCIGIAEKGIVCTETVDVGAGDLFQKRRCETHQRKFARMRARPGLSEEEKKSREAQRENEKVAREEKRANEKATRAAERAEIDKQKLNKKMAEIEAKKAAAQKLADEKKAALETAQAAKKQQQAAKKPGTSAAA